jgi:alpha-tubulin suppressor-like RCC1 family protein
MCRCIQEARVTLESVIVRLRSMSAACAARALLLSSMALSALACGPAPAAEALKVLAAADIRMCGVYPLLHACPPDRLGNVVQIAAGDETTYAVTSNGSVYQWGGLGAGVLRPQLIPWLSGVSQVATSGPGGNGTCALLGNSTVQCWTGPSGQSANPVGGLAAAAVQVSFSCARLSALLFWGTWVDGTVQCWDSGATTTLAFYRSDLASGLNFHCSAGFDGTVACWGTNSFGQLGLGNGSSGSATAQTIPGLAGVTRVFSGYAASSMFAVRADGSVMGWGFNDGVLGDGSTVVRTTPVPCPGYQGATQLSIGYLTSCAAFGNGAVACTGMNDHGQVGDGTRNFQAVPQTVSGLSSVVQVAVSDHHSCALDNAGNVYCWGGNDANQVGDGIATSTDRLHPVAVVGP